MKSHTPKQVSQYDKILKENLEAVIPILIQKIIGIQTSVSEEIPDDIQHTKERKPDALKRITDPTGQTFVLHIEFQVADEPKMIHRMHNYCAMLMQKYEIPVRQYVFYLGAVPAQMTSNLVTDDLAFRYNLISFQQLDYQLFLTSTIPEEVLLAILANFQPQESPQVLAELLNRLNETAGGPLVFQKYIAQLRVLVQLRNLQSLFETTMDDISKYINEKNDPFYLKGHNLGFLLGTEKGIQEGTEKGLQKGIERGLQEGIEKGLQKGQANAQSIFVKNLIAETDFSDEKIAQLAGVSPELVQKARQKPGKK